MVFPTLVALVVAFVSGPSPYVVFLFFASFVVAGVVGVVLVPLLGVPLALAAARLLRDVPSVPLHLLGQFLAGVVAGGAVATAFILVTGTSDDLSQDGVLASALGAAAVTGVAAMTGWYLALRRYRRPPKPDPYGTADEDVD